MKYLRVIDVLLWAVASETLFCNLEFASSKPEGDKRQNPQLSDISIKVISFSFSLETHQNPDGIFRELLQTTDVNGLRVIPKPIPLDQRTH